MEDYDGISERQDTAGKLPLGWLIFFIGVIIWGVWYMFVYVPVGSWSQTAVYEEAVKAEAPVTGPTTDTVPAANPYKGSAHEVAEGANLYAENCAGCHGDKAEGGIAPPLVRVEQYVYGGSDSDLFISVMDGRGGGMPAFKSTLGEKKVWEVLAYIDSINK
jgi:mono/diheme cytochrome c family protein